MFVAALAAMAVAAGVGVVAAGLAIYAGLNAHFGPAWAAAGVAAAAVLGISLGGVLAARQARPAQADQDDARDQLGLVTQLMDLVRDKPLASAGVALAAGLVLMRNPGVIGVILRSLLDAKAGGGETGGKGRRAKP